MKKELPQFWRIVSGVIWIVILVLIAYMFSDKGIGVFFNSGEDKNIIYYSGALMIILGAYMVEPFFTRPVDVIVNAVSVILALLSIDNTESLIGYKVLFCAAWGILLLAVLSVALKDSKQGVLRAINRVVYLIITTLGKGKVIFSAVYISALFSYFTKENELHVYIALIVFWSCLVFFDLVGNFIKGMMRIFSSISNNAGELIGTAIGCENPFLYRVEIDLKGVRSKISFGDVVLIRMSYQCGIVGIVIDKRSLLNKQWLSVYILQNDEYEALGIKSNDIGIYKKSIFTGENYAYLLDKIDKSKISQEKWKEIEDTYLYKNKSQLIGYVTHGSNIKIINFSILSEVVEGRNKIFEGAILKVSIYGKETLYQIINGKTEKEILENHDTHGYTVGVAQKMGCYDVKEQELNTVKWMPDIYAPVCLTIANNKVEDSELKNIAKNAIGRLPETDMAIPIKDINSLVTHNTAILGILGIGKSCLAYEIISKVVKESIKVICIDVTGEYLNEKNGLPTYVKDVCYQYEEPKFTKPSSNEVYDSKDEGGHVKKLRGHISDEIDEFMKSEKYICTINPNKIIAYTQTDNAKNRMKDEKWEMYAPFSKMTVSEITRIISEVALEVCQLKGIDKKARLLLVYEEAHSLIPEWNSVVNERDKTAVNGTAKVILQGRKYGLGCLVVTQRTANISKSILNQCNTIFALRVFDDTGKAFLENYIGKDYAEVLPTLEERHAIVIGKALKLKQPSIIQLNDRKYFTENNDNSELNFEG